MGIDPGLLRLPQAQARAPRRFVGQRTDRLARGKSQHHLRQRPGLRHWFPSRQNAPVMGFLALLIRVTVLIFVPVKPSKYTS